MTEIYYFGCNKVPGHYMHARGMRTGETLEERRAIGRLTEANPWGYAIDGGLAPKGINEREGIADIRQKDGWTAISFWDRSVDTRRGCNSTFLARGIYDFRQMMTMAREAFPTVFSRFSFGVRAVKKTDANSGPA
jgi:hypothetical protein